MQDGTVHVQEGLDLDQDPLVLANQHTQDLDQDPLVLVIDLPGTDDTVHNSVDSPSSNIQLGEFVQAGKP